MKTKLFNILFLSLCLKLANGHASEVDLLQNKQWYLGNIGQVISKNVSELERTFIKGIPGVDINWVKPKELNISNDREVIVAVIDSGIDLNHPDLKERIWYNSKLCQNLPTTKNQPCYGWNFINNTSDLKDDVGHGTHVAGIIAANNNAIGISGLTAKNVKIMPLKVIDAQVSGFVVNGKLFTDIVSEAINFAVKNGASIINLSMGWPKVVDTFKIRQAIKYAEQNNVLVIAAAGNNSKDLPTFPCSYDSVICVGAIDNTESITEFSNYGAKIDLAAPGEFIVSTIPEGLESRLLRIKGYDSKRGSSQASPIVAGVAASLKLLKPSLKVDELKALMLLSSKKLKDQSRDKILFGTIKMRESLDLLTSKSNETLIYPFIKENTEIKILGDQNSQFKLKLKKLQTNLEQSLESTEEKIEVCLNSISGDVVSKCALSSIGTLKNLDLTFDLILTSLKIDSHQNFKLVIKREKNTVEEYPLTLIFSRDLLNIQTKEQVGIQNLALSDLVGQSNDRLVSRLQPVLRDRNEGLKFSIIERSFQTKENTVATILKFEENQNSTAKFNVVLPKLNRLISIHERDINLDGINDYLFYGLNEKKDQLILAFFNRNGEPLWPNGKHVWFWELSVFEGLPVDANNENFNWVKVNSEFGDILVPSFLREFGTPELDNSKSILDRLIGTRNHLFYLKPIFSNGKMIIELRVFDSFNVRSLIKEQLSLIDDLDLIAINRVLPQTKEDKKEGRIKAIMSLRNSQIGKSYTLEVDNGTVRIKELNSSIPGISQSIAYSVVDELGRNTNEFVFSTLLNRSSTRNLFFDLNLNVDTENLIFKSKGYEDPIINLVQAFKLADSYGIFFENRYSLNYVDSKTFERFELPVYRDSSFPGVNFSETMIPFTSNGAPSLFVNSTLIFGDRLYVASKNREGFLRPVQNSVAIPKTCANAGFQFHAEEPVMSFICVENGNTASLVLFKIKGE